MKNAKKKYPVKLHEKKPETKELVSSEVRAKAESEMVNIDPVSGNFEPKANKNLIIGAGVLVILVIGYLLFKNLFVGNIDKMKSEVIPTAVRKIEPRKDFKFKVGEVKKLSPLYEFKIEIGEDKNKKIYTSYVTEDGEYFIIDPSSLIRMSELGKSKSTTPVPTAKPMTCADVKKSEAPKLTLFVMSQCPYGLQMQRAFKTAIDSVPELAQNLEVRYIGSLVNGKIESMHGEEEATEDLRQICIRDEQPNLYWSYVGCYMKAGKFSECLTEVGVDTASLAACMDDSSRGIAYFQKDVEMAKKIGDNLGSPTLVSGDQRLPEFDFGGRTPDAVRRMVCCASKEKLAYCETELSKDSMAVGFSESVKGAGGAAASCN